MFERLGIKHGREKGKMLRANHLAVQLPLLEGEELLEEAQNYALQKYLSVSSFILHNGNEKEYRDFYVHSFVLAYTDMNLVLQPNIPLPSVSVHEVNYEEEMRVDYTD